MVPLNKLVSVPRGASLSSLGTTSAEKLWTGLRAWDFGGIGVGSAE